MFARSTKTKLIWTVTENHLREHGPSKIAQLITENGIQAVKAIYTESIRSGLTELRKELTQRLGEAQANPDPDGLVPFLLSFVSRRALLDCGAEPTSLEEKAEITLDFELDTAFCSQNLHRGTAVARPRVAVTAADMLAQLGEGSHLSFSYGEAELTIEKIVSRTDTSLTVSARVVTEGQISSGMTVTSPHISNELFPLLAEDQASLTHQFDGLADFVVINGLRAEAEVSKIKNYFYKEKARLSKRHPSVPIGPTIREPEGQVPPRFVIKIDSEPMLGSFSQLLDQVDGVYLSRAELGTLVHPHDLPVTQKEIIRNCNRDAKLVMVASELMHSMRVNPNPTRAEVSDLANAVTDGADALVLEQDVTEGPFPRELAKVSRDTLEKTEPKAEQRWSKVGFELRSDDDAVAFGAIETAEHVGAKAIVCLTEGGYTAARLSSNRTPVDVIAITYNRQVMRQMSLYRSVFPVRISSATAFDRVLAETKACLVEHCGMVRGDKFVFISLTASSISERQSNFFTIQILD